MQACVQGWAKERWLGFREWVKSGVSGIHPLTLRLTLGTIAGRMGQARQVAGSLNRWLLAVLAERQRLGLVVQRAGFEQEEADLLEADSCQQPYRQPDLERQERWLRWLLLAELLRLVRLAEAPEEALCRPDWLGVGGALLGAGGQSGAHRATVCRAGGTAGPRGGDERAGGGAGSCVVAGHRRGPGGVSRCLTVICWNGAVAERARPFPTFAARDGGAAGRRGL